MSQEYHIPDGAAEYARSTPYGTPFIGRGVGRYSNPRLVRNMQMTMYAWNGQSQQGVQEEYHQIFKVQQVCQGCIHLQYICLSCVSGVHLTLHLFCRCTTEVVLLQQGVLLGSSGIVTVVVLHYSCNKDYSTAEIPMGRSTTGIIKNATLRWQWALPVTAITPCSFADMN